MELPDTTQAPVDVALEQLESRLKEFGQYQKEDLSESDTRSKVIDPVLEILGWKEPSIRREWHDRKDGKYLDYRLSTTQPIFVVEAKKQFVDFELPGGGMRFFRIGGVIKKTDALHEAILQARNYALNTGIVFCCVTNGFQYIFFRASNSAGISWENQMVVIFRDHQDITKRFQEFFELFSYESVSCGRAAALLPVSHLPAHVATRFHRFGTELKLDYETRDRNALFPYTREIIKQIFQSLDNDDTSPELLEHCYVESARDSSYERGIGELLKEHRTKIPGGAEKIETKKKDAGNFQSHFERNATKASQVGSVTLLLGTLGAGKTTFLNRFRKVFAKELIDKEFVWLLLSFNSFAESEDNLADWVNESIKSALREDYHEVNPFSWESLKKVYETEISELREGVLNPLYRHDKIQFEIKLADEIRILTERSDTHLIKCLDYFSKISERQVIIVFDNADQHSPDFQNQVFLLAQKYSQYLRCMAFISLREESYWKNKDFGGLSAFHSTSFQISAPRIEQVLAKRFKYASKVILEDPTLAADNFVVSSLGMNREKIQHIFRTLQNSLLGDDKRFVRFLEYTSPGEVRRSLDFVARFLTSGHTNVNRIMDRASKNILEPVGFHEFLQAVMLGDRVHYREDLSDVINLFAADGHGDQSHFNRIAILSRVLSASSESSSRGKGYVPLSEVVDDCESIGITPETSLRIIGTLIQKRLLITDTLIRDSVGDGTHIKATSAALYYLSELAVHFTYIDLVLIDTEIGRDDVRQTMRDLSRAIFSENDRFKRLELRLERVKQFIAYLELEFKESSLSRTNAKFDEMGKSFISKLAGGFEAQAKVILDNARIAFRRN